MKNIFVLIATIVAGVLGFLVLEKAETKRQRVPAQYAYVNEQDPYGVSNIRKINGLRMEIYNELKMMESLGELIEIVESVAITQESRASVKEFADDGEPSSNDGKIVIDGIYLDDNDVIFAIEVWQRLVEVHEAPSPRFQGLSLGISFISVRHGHHGGQGVLFVKPRNILGQGDELGHTGGPGCLGIAYKGI